MVSINDLTNKIEDSPVKKTPLLLHSDKLKQPSLNDYEEWMRRRAKNLNIDCMKGSNKVYFFIQNLCKILFSK